MTILSGYMNPKLKNPAFDEGRLTDCNVVDSIDDLIVVDGDPLDQAFQGTRKPSASNERQFKVDGC